MMLQTPIIITNSGPLPPNYDIYLIDASNDSLTVILPNITCDGTYFRICRIDNNSDNSVTINPYAPSQTINGNGSTSISPGPVSGIELVSLNDVWYSI